MISSYYGRRQSLATLRRQFRVSMTGSSVSSISRMAQQIGFSTRAVRVNLQDLKKLRCPAMLHWQLDHFVVLNKVRRKGLVVHDPARGKRFVCWSDVSRYFSGVAVEFTLSAQFEPGNDIQRVRLRDLWSKSQGLGSSLLQIFLLSALLQFFSLLAPLVNQMVVDDAIARNDGDFLVAILLGFGLLLASQTAVQALRSTALLHFSQMLAFQLRSNLLLHLLHLPTDFFERRHVGDVVSRLNSIAPVQQLISSAVVSVVLDGLLAIGTVAVMYLYSPPLTALVIAATCLAFLARLLTFPYVRRLTEEKISADAKLHSVLLESIRAIRTIKLFNRESERHTYWQNTFIDATNIGIQLQKFGITAAAGSGLLLGVLDLAVFYVGANAVMSGTLTLGMLFSFQAYRTQFSTRLDALIGQFFLFRTTGVHLERLADIVQTEPDADSTAFAIQPSAIRGKVEVRRGRFRYGADLPWLLNDVNFVAEPGERIALVGKSGCGKSTFLKVLVGLYPLSGGDIAFDDIPVSTNGMQLMRRHIGTVMQDDRLLSGTIADNICFLDEAPDENMLIEVATRAQILADVQRLPMGFDTLVGDMGSVLSGGQRQRILLARALYKQPKMLLLDEGTANLDTDTERKLLNSLAELDITQILVAHRPAAIAACDRVVLVSDGRLRQLPNQCSHRERIT